MLKKLKKQIVNGGIYEEFGFQMFIIFRKIFHDFQKFFDKVFNI